MHSLDVECAYCASAIHCEVDVRTFGYTWLCGACLAPTTARKALEGHRLLEIRPATMARPCKLVVYSDCTYYFMRAGRW